MTAPDLRGLLAGYRGGAASLGDVEAAVEAWLRDVPGDAAAVLGVLQEARGEGLGEADFARLAARVAAAGGGDDDRTRMLPGGTGGRGGGPSAAAGDPREAPTVVSAQAGTRGDPAAATAPAGADDRTRVIPGGTGTSPRPAGESPETGGGGESAPVTQGGDDRTRVIPGGTGSRSRPAGESPETGGGGESAPVTQGGDDRTRVIPGGTGSRSRPAGESPETGGGGEPAPVTQGGDDRTRVIPGGTGSRSRPAGESPAAGGGVESAPVTQGGDDDRTLVFPGGTGGDGAAPRGAGEAATVGGVAGESVAPPTGSSAPAGGGPDPRQPTTQDSWPAPQGASRDLGAGDVIKDRFRLVEPLGSGGMGTVWKAVDKLKEEARERNPFVAVKLLTGDFRDHPEAFIALQRESAKQQRLAHPNIATVFDFDRDGDTVYMTMEVMTGKPLDQFIASLPEGGLAYEEALPIIEALGAGLAYAHQGGLVHSDMKPGNAFLTAEGSVKLLDFGIARSSKTRTTAGGETTVFDPGQLGALTPSYATVEMFEGMDPDPRDDIYAFAIIAYQLLTGRHPYDRRSAPRALQMGLTPEPIAKLTRRQNQALRQGLVLERDGRIESVEAFLHGIRPYHSPLPWIAAVAVVVLAIIGTLSWRPVMEYLDEREREAIIEVFTAGGQASIDRAMAMVAALDDPAQREAIAADPRTRSAIIALHVARSRGHFEPQAQRYDWASAEAVMDELTALFPDSAEVLQLRTDLMRERDETLGRLAERYGQLVAEGRLVRDPDAEDVLDVRAAVARIDPAHPMLEDPRLPARYEAVAREAMTSGDWERARAVLDAGVEATGERTELLALRERVVDELRRLSAQRRVVELEASLSGRGWTALSDFDAAREELLELSALRPSHEVLAAARPRLSEAFGNAFEGLLGAGDAVRARRRLVSYAGLLEAGAVRGYRARLEPAGIPAAEESEVAARVELLQGLLGSAQGGETGPQDAAWASRAGVAYRELVALSGEGAAAVGEQRAALSTLYLERAAALGAQERYEEALGLLARGESLLAGGEPFAREREVLARAEEAKRRREEEARRLARIEALREALRGHAREGRVVRAREALESLRAEVAPGDAFVAVEGPGLIAQAYLRRAQAAAQGGAAEAAWREARAGLEVAPGDAALEAARSRYRGAVEARALALQRRGTAGTGAEGAPLAAEGPVAAGVGRPALQAGGPVAIRGEALVPGLRPAVSGAQAVGEDAARYPALSPAQVAELAAGVVTRAREAMASGDWERSRAVLEAGVEVAGGRAELLALREQVAAELRRVAAQRRVAELEAALSGRGWTALPDFDAARGELLELAELRPLHPVLSVARPRLSEVFGKTFEGLLRAGDAPGALRRLVSYAGLLEAGAVRGYRARLESAGIPAAEAPEAAARVAVLRGLLESAQGGETGPQDAAWASRAGAAYRELVALSGEGAAAVGEQRAALSTLYLERAAALGAQERYEEALALLARGEALLAGGEPFARELEALARAEEVKRRREEEARRLARIEALREALRGHAREDRAAQAREALAALRAEVAPGDAFVAVEGPGLIAQAYLRRAQAAAEGGAAEAAWREARAGLEVAPGDAALEAARSRYRGAVEARSLALQRRGAAGTGAQGAPLAAEGPVAAGVGRPALQAGGPVAIRGEALVPGLRPAVSGAQAVGEDAARYPALSPARVAELAAGVVTRAREAMASGDWERSRAVLEAGVEVAGERAELLALGEQVAAELRRVAAQRRVAELEAALSGRGWTALPDFDAARGELLELGELRPSHPVLSRAWPRLSEVFENVFAGLLSAGDARGALRRLVSYAGLLEAGAVRGYRARLEPAGIPAAEAPEVAARVAVLRGLLESAQGGETGPQDSAWASRAGAAYRELVALSGEGAAAVGEQRAALSTLYLERAAALGAQERYEEALALLARGEALLAGGEPFARGREALARAEEAKRRREEEARRLARIEALREALRGHAREDRAAQAREALAALRAEVAPGDAFVAVEGPGLIAQAHLRRAQAAAEGGAAEAAWREARAGLEVAPGDAALEAARSRYRGAVAERALVLQRRGAAGPGGALLATGARIASGGGDAIAGLDGVAADAAEPAGEFVPAVAGDEPGSRPAVVPVLDDAMAKRVGARIASRASGEPRAVAALARPLAGFGLLYPERHAALRRAVAEALGARLDALAAVKDAPAHNALLDAAQGIGLFRGRADIEGPKPSQMIASLGLQQLDAGELAAAARTAEQVRGEQPDATNLEEFGAEIERRRREASAAFGRYERSARARQLRTARQHLDKALALWSDNPDYEAALQKLERTNAVLRGACVASLAGHGKRRRGRCHDTVAGARGPTLVVVPAASGGAAAFAIGRNEVTVADFNHYCKSSGACSPLGGAGNLPATGVPLAQVRAYAAWMSKESGATYRLPTEEEWRYAANAAGQQPRKDYNCRVMKDGAVIKGHNLVSAGTGTPNGWGLINYVGNAREWVTAGAGVAVRGGAFTDSLVDCGIEMRDADDGAADMATGFRLLRELG